MCVGQNVRLFLDPKSMKFERNTIGTKPLLKEQHKVSALCLVKITFALYDLDYH